MELGVLYYPGRELSHIEFLNPVLFVDTHTLWCVDGAL